MKRTPLVLIAAVIGAPALLWAQVPNGAEFRVNTYTIGAQAFPSIASDASGNFVVVWGGEGPGDGDGVFGQRLTSIGAQLGTEFPVNSSTPGSQNSPAVAADEAGNFVAVWNSGADVVGQRFASTGAQLGTEFQVSSPGGAHRFPAVATEPSGSFVVVWENLGNFRVSGQRFASTGMPLGTEFQANTYIPAFHFNPAIATASNGQFVVVWDSTPGQDGHYRGVFGQRFGSDGTPLGPEFQVNTYTTDYQSTPSVAAADDGSFVVVWQSLGQVNDLDVFGQRFDSDGGPLGIEFQVNTYTTSSQALPVVASISDGDFIVTWQGPDPNSTGVFGRRFAHSGVPQGTEFRVNTDVTGAQTTPVVAGDAAGDRLLVVWASLGQDGSGDGIFGQRLGPPPCTDPLVFEANDFRFDGVGGVDGLNDARAVALSPDGKCLYVASFGDDVIGVFKRDLLTGDLTFVNVETGNPFLDGAAGVAVSPDGSHVYVTGERADRLSGYARNATTCDLASVGAGSALDSTLDGARGVAVSPDGMCIYVAASRADAVVAYKRTASSGALTFVEAKTDGTGGVECLDGASSVAVTPDGLHLYAAGEVDNGVAEFSRNPATCALTFLPACERDGVGGVEGLEGARAVAVSPDGLSVYVAGKTDAALAVFRRNSATGALSFIEVHKDGIGAVNGLNNVGAVAVGPNGGQVYTAAESDDAVAAFNRDSATGRLTFAEAVFDDLGGIDGLNGAHGVAVSPNGSHVYAVGSVDNAIVWFRGCCGNGILESGEQCDDGRLFNGDCCSSACKFETQNGCCSFDVCQAGMPGCFPPCGGACALSNGACVCQ